MSTVLGLLGVLVFVPCVIGIAAGVTWLVIRLTPGEKNASGKTAKPAGS